MADNADKVRDAIAETARMRYEHAQKQGQSVTYSELRDDTARIREQGDRKRENNNR